MKHKPSFKVRIPSYLAQQVKETLRGAGYVTTQTAPLGTEVVVCYKNRFYIYSEDYWDIILKKIPAVDTDDFLRAIGC